MKASTKNTNSDPAIRILKSATCPSLSGKSKLAYQIGCTDESEIQIRLVGNSNAGAFNQHWVDLQAIQAAFDKVPRGEPVTADASIPLFRDMSLNTPFFVWAVLKHEGIVHASKTKKRCYDRADAKVVTGIVQALLEGKGAPVVDAKGKRMKGTKVAPAKRPSPSRKR